MRPRDVGVWRTRPRPSGVVPADVADAVPARAATCARRWLTIFVAVDASRRPVQVPVWQPRYQSRTRGAVVAPERPRGPLVAVRHGKGLRPPAQAQGV